MPPVFIAPRLRRRGAAARVRPTREPRVEVFSPECQTLTNGTEDVDPKEIKSERVVIVGALFKDDGARDVTEQRLRSVRVALSDIEKAGGIPAGRGAGSEPRRARLRRR